MIGVRRARPADAPEIGAVHVAAWRSAYPGLLPDEYLAGLSAPRQAAYYDGAIRGRGCVLVATASGIDVPAGSPPRIIGFATAGPARWTDATGRRLAEGEIETLYLLDDWRDRGIGRRLLRASAAALSEQGCRNVFLWVLRDNPSRWFYEHLGGRRVAEATVRVGGRTVSQTAFMWDPIDRLLEESTRASQG